MNTINIAQMSDLHYAPDTVEEVDRCFGHAVDGAISKHCDAAVISGDLFDRAVNLHDPSVARLLSQVRRLAEHMPVLILQGTRSHDTPGSLNVFKTIGGWFPVHVADTIQQVALTQDPVTEECEWVVSSDWIFDAIPAHSQVLISCLPSVNKGAVAAAVGAKDAAEAVGDYVADLLAGWSTSHCIARDASIPTVLVSHGTVSGCLTEHGVPMAGLDHEYTTGSLFVAEASAVMLGHIHQHQSWEHEGRRIAYPGSIGRLHFGELQDKGYLVWTVGAASAEFEFNTTPAKQLVQIEFNGSPDMEVLRQEVAKAAGAHVRIRYQIDEDKRHTVDRKAIEALFASAEQVKVEGRINPIERRRSEGMNEAHSLADKLKKWGEASDTDTSALMSRLALLQQKTPEEIVAKVVDKLSGKSAA